MPAASRIAKAVEPEVWRKFVQAFGEYTAHFVTQCIICDDADQLRRVQGQARVCDQLFSLFKDAREWKPKEGGHA
jgi:hypothetical protein